MLDAPVTPSVAVAGSNSRFAVRRIFCVGRNYTAHAREMGHDPTREPPFFFTKPADCVVDDGVTLPFPTKTENLHFEGELVVAIGTGGANIDAKQALDHVWGYAPGNDLTRRDMQARAKEMRRPWDMAKGFDNSAVCGALHSVASIGHLSRARISTQVNGQVLQDSDIGDMIWPVADVIAYLSSLVALAPGDLIFAGTPAGVGPLVSGDRCCVEIEGLGQVITVFA